jgi:hypothetical protein
MTPISADPNLTKQVANRPGTGIENSPRYTGTYTLKQTPVLAPPKFTAAAVTQNKNQ